MNSLPEALKHAERLLNSGDPLGHIEHFESIARALVAAMAVVRAAETFAPKLNSLRRQFPPCDSWFAQATCIAEVEFDREEWDHMEALRLAIDTLRHDRATRGGE